MAVKMKKPAGMARRLITGGADMPGYLLFLLLIVVMPGVKVKLIIGPP